MSPILDFYNREELFLVRLAEKNFELDKKYGETDDTYYEIFEKTMEKLRIKYYETYMLLYNRFFLSDEE